MCPLHFTGRVGERNGGEPEGSQVSLSHADLSFVPSNIHSEKHGEGVRLRLLTLPRFLIPIPPHSPT